MALDGLNLDILGSRETTINSSYLPVASICGLQLLLWMLVTPASCSLLHITDFDPTLVSKL
jgi:hypothetical protein